MQPRHLFMKYGEKLRKKYRKRSQAPHMHAIRATSIVDYSWSP